MGARCGCTPSTADRSGPGSVNLMCKVKFRMRALCACKFRVSRIGAEATSLLEEKK